MSLHIFFTHDVEGLMNTLAAGEIPSGAIEIYRGRNVVAKLPEEGINIKAYKVPGLVKGLIYGLLRKPKALRAYDNAFELLRLGIRTPEPLGVLVERKAGRLSRSFFVSRQLEGWSELRGAEKRSDFAGLVKTLAEFIFDMHRKGVYMKDMTPGNVLFRTDGSNFELALVDINRMSFGVTDMQLLRSKLGLVFDTEDAGAFLARTYAALAGIDEDAAEDAARRAYRKRWRTLRRKQRLKSLLGIKPH